MREPLVSIVMPTYNAERYIKEAIQSVLLQTYKNWELLIVDDGSIDRTAEIIKPFKDRRIRYIYQKNQGQSAARNTALAKARGLYVAFLDSDDIFLPLKLEHQTKFMEAHPECDFSYSKINYFWDNKPAKIYFLNIDHPSGFLKDELIQRGGHTMAPISVMFRREWYDKYGGFDSKFRRSDEYFFYLKMALRGANFCYLDEVLALNRLHNGSLTRDESYLKETAETNFKIFDWLEKELPQSDPARRWLSESRRKWQLRLALGHFILKDKESGIRELKKLSYGKILWLIFYILPASYSSWGIKFLRKLKEKSLFQKLNENYL